MAVWGIVAAMYGLVLTVAALTQPIARRPVAVAAAVAYAMVGFGTASLVDFWANLFIPGGLLLTGYWLSGLFFRAPQRWLEQWLLASDRALGADRWLDRMPRWMGEVLEASYAADYVVIGGGALYAATAGVDAVSHYWSMVLPAELACYAALPWLRSRPPRVLEVGSTAGLTPTPSSSLLDATQQTAGVNNHRQGGLASHHRQPEGLAITTQLPEGVGLTIQTPERMSIAAQPSEGMGIITQRPENVSLSPAAPFLRRLNTTILDRASVQANTIPSGHVAGAVAAAFGVLPVDATTGWCLMVIAGLIATAAAAGRYHYVVDCVAGVAVAVVVWSLS